MKSTNRQTKPEFNQLEVRTKNSLIQAGINTTDQLIEFISNHGAGRLLELRNFGLKCYKDIINNDFRI